MATSIWQKFAGSIADRGLAGTFKHARMVCTRAAMQYLDAGFDRRFGTETTQIVELSNLTIASKNAKDGIYYEAIPERVLRDMLDGLDIDYSQFTFIDFGSGKGRAMLIAADYPFRKVIGVEFAPALHEVALSNIARYKNPAQKCRDIQSICEDATTYELPPENIVAFLYTPFKPPVLKVVIDRLVAAFQNSPRDLVIAFYGSEPVSLKILNDTGLQTRRLKIRHDFTHPVQRLALILRHQSQSSR